MGLIKMKLKRLSVIVLLAGFTSCQKCQTCTTTQTNNSSGTEQTSQTHEDYCGSEYDSAPTETSYTQNSGGATYEVEITCVDN